MSPLAQLLAQSSASGANPAPFRATVAPTDVEKAYSDYNSAMDSAYKNKVAQQNAMWGGLAQLGGAGISSLPKLLGSAGTAAAGADISAAAMAGLTDALGAAAIL